MRILAIDYGTKKIGLATSDELGITVSELPILLVGQSVFSDLSEIIKKYVITHILVGMPYNDDGSENESCDRIFTFIQDLDIYLKGNYDLELEFIIQNENGSSRDIRKELKKKDEKKIDSKVAKKLLEDYLRE